MRSLGCQHTDVVFNIKHTVADGISNGNANGPFRNDFTSPVYLICIIFLEVSTIFLFNYEKREIEKRTKMKTCINISFPSKVRFRKKVHSQASDHVWFFLNLFSKRPREKKKRKKELASYRPGEKESDLKGSLRVLCTASDLKKILISNYM